MGGGGVMKFYSEKKYDLNKIRIYVVMYDTIPSLNCFSTKFKKVQGQVSDSNTCTYTTDIYFEPVFTKN